MAHCRDNGDKFLVHYFEAFQERSSQNVIYYFTKNQSTDFIRVVSKIPFSVNIVV